MDACLDKKYILLISGDGPERDKLERLTDGSVRIIFIGNIKGISKIYQISDYFISASFSEGLPSRLKKPPGIFPAAYVFS